MSRQGDIFGGSEIFDKFNKLAEKCGQFRFFMESDIWAGDDRSDSTGITARADFKFSMSILKDPIEGDIDVVDTYLGSALATTLQEN